MQLEGEVYLQSLWAKSHSLISSVIIFGQVCGFEVIILRCVLVEDLCWMVRVVPHYFIFCHDTVSPVFVILRMLTVLTKDLKFSNPFCSISLTIGEIHRIRFIQLLISCTLAVAFFCVFSIKA